MRTLLTYFSNRLEESVLKWNANSLKNTNIFMIIVIYIFCLFLFLPLCAHVIVRLFPTYEAKVVLPLGQIICFEMQGNIFLCVYSRKMDDFKIVHVRDTSQIRYGSQCKNSHVLLS